MENFEMKSKLTRSELVKYFLDFGEDRASRDLRNPLFVGRDQEINHVLRLVEKSKSQNHDLTILFHGSPGAGKSELMYEIVERLRRADEFPNVVPIILTKEHLQEPLTLADSIFGHLPETSQRKIRLLGSKNQIKRALQISNVKPGAQNGNLGLGFDQSIDWFKRWVVVVKEYLADTIFVMCVDEIQNLVQPSRSLIPTLNQGVDGLNLIPVYFGINNAVDRLEEAGLSELSEGNRILVGRLSDENAELIFRTFSDLMDFDIARGVSEPWWHSIFIKSGG